jgi:23S rRNA (guanosine2251-2'-O)-methyltransferase
MKLDAKQLRVSKPGEEELAQLIRKPLYIVLDNVLDTYNIGSFFRLADATGATEVILCGESETPPSSRIHKAAVGTEEWVKWRYFADAKAAIEKLRSEFPNIKIIAVEQDVRSIPLAELKTRVGDDQPVAVVVGHETHGVATEVLDEADTIVEIPMFGINKSLNVHVSASVIIYKLLIGC